MKTYTSDELKKILADHKAWFDRGGVNASDQTGRANLSGANLSGANLSRANLSGANLSRANLSRANLSRANLSGADLSRANLSRADLSRADLSRADLYGANLSGADLSRADLSGANLSRANLSGADLSGANLSRADLSRADLFGANLSGANLSGANLSRADLYGANLSGANLSGANLYGANLSLANMTDTKTDEKTVIEPVCTLPEEGSFVAWKKVIDSQGRGIVLKLEIIGRSVSAYIGRKCRADQVRVIAAYGPQGDERAGTFFSKHDRNFTYEVGAVVEEKAFDPNPCVECTKGIHFFMTKQEAIDY